MASYQGNFEFGGTAEGGAFSRAVELGASALSWARRLASTGNTAALTIDRAERWQQAVEHTGQAILESECCQGSVPGRWGVISVPVDLQPGSELAGHVLNVVGDLGETPPQAIDGVCLLLNGSGVVVEMGAVTAAVDMRHYGEGAAAVGVLAVAGDKPIKLTYYHAENVRDRAGTVRDDQLVSLEIIAAEVAVRAHQCFVATQSSHEARYFGDTPAHVTDDNRFVTD